MEPSTFSDPGAPPSDPFASLLQFPGWAGSPALPWLVHGFSTRWGGCSTAYAMPGSKDLNLGFTSEDDRLHVLQNRETLRCLLARRSFRGEGSAALAMGGPADLDALARMVTMRQVHSSISHRVTEANSASVPDGDGMMTDEPGWLLAIQTADCVPVLVLDCGDRGDRGHRAVAAFHAGWRGTAQSVVALGVQKMRAEFGSRAENLSAVIGPCIGGCCYTVGEEVRAEFATRFAYADALFQSRATSTGQETRLDLVEANRRQLVEAGVAASQVHALDQCTSCHPERFFSYRRSGGRTGRMMSVIGIAG